MDTSKLRPDTQAAWNALKDQPHMQGFVLIGGTALAMHIGHRISEDLDFAYLEPQKHLPKRQLLELCAAVRAQGVSMVLDQNPLDIEEFFDSGLELDNYQQNFVINNLVKVSFACFDNPMDRFITGLRTDKLRVATLDEIFKTKVFDCSERSKERDWFDLFVLVNKHGYTFSDMHRVYKSVDRLPAFENMSMRLRKCKPSAINEGTIRHQ